MIVFCKERNIFQNFKNPWDCQLLFQRHVVWLPVKDPTYRILWVGYLTWPKICNFLKPNDVHRSQFITSHWCEIVSGAQTITPATFHRQSTKSSPIFHLACCEESTKPTAPTYSHSCWAHRKHQILNNVRNWKLSFGFLHLTRWFLRTYDESYLYWVRHIHRW